MRPEILRSWDRSERGGHPRRRRGAARRRGRHRGVLARLAAADGRRAGRGRAAAYGRGRRPGHRGHRRRDPDPLDVRRPGDAPQGRDRELRAGRPLGRGQRRHQRARDLANRTGESSMVFSAEHYASIVHNWVCWAAPLHDPVTGEQIGVIDLSTTWDRTHPIGLATARVMARLIETAMPSSQRWRTARSHVYHDEPGLVLSLLGTAEAWLDGQRLLLNRRQTEVLALLDHASRGTVARAPPRPGVRRPVGHDSHAEGRGLPPPPRPRRPARVAPLPADAAGRGPTSTRCSGCSAAARSRRDRGVRRRPAARHQRPAPWSSSRSTSRSACARRCSPTRTPTAVLRYSELAPYDAEVVEVCLAALGAMDAPGEAPAQGPSRRRQTLTSSRAGPAGLRANLSPTLAA